MASPVQPLDFESIISYAIGDATLFIYIALVAFSILAAKVRMPIGAYMMLMLIFIIIMNFTIGTGIAIVAIIFTAIWVAITFVKNIKQ